MIDISVLILIFVFISGCLRSFLYFVPSQENLAKGTVASGLQTMVGVSQHSLVWEGILNTAQKMAKTSKLIPLPKMEQKRSEPLK